MQDLSGLAGAAWAAAEVRFNPYHAPAGAGGGEFTSASGGGKTAPKAKAAAKTAGKPKTKKAARLPAAQPNGLGYSAAEWKQLQQLEADAKAGKKLDAHQEHLLHVAHEKHLTAQAAAEAAAKKAAAAPKAATAVKSAKKSASPKKPPVNTPAKTFAGHPVKGA